MEVQMGKSPTCLNPFLMRNLHPPPMFVSPWASMSAPIFESGMSNGHGAFDLCMGRKGDMMVIYREYLFSKILTTSDVGKLNRLLIPRQCAEECFPKISEAKSGGDDVFLNFEDFSTGFIWRFRFCLWNNSKTYVLTKGWHVFIKEKNLKKGDMVSFYRDASKTASTDHMFIHIEPRTNTLSLPHRVPSPIFSPSSLMVDDHPKSLGFGTSHGIVPALKPLSFGFGEFMPPTNLMPQQFESASLEIERAEKHLRLFGVDIGIPSHDYGDESCCGFTNNAA